MRTLVPVSLFLAALAAFGPSSPRAEDRVRALTPEQALAAAGEAARRGSPGAAFEALATDELAKSTANGLYLDGSFSYEINGSTVALRVARINNDSTSRTTGTLRLELWASASRPSRGVGFTGYRLAIGNTLSPLAPRTFYSDVLRTTAFTEPPDGTYYMVMVLSEFDSVNCPASDRFCITDSGVFSRQETFGAPTPPPPPSNGLVTIISRAGDQCYENYPAAALELLNQGAPGLFQSHPSTTTCASLGMPVYAGLLGTDSSVRVYSSSADGARNLCATGLLTGCSNPASSATYTDLWWNPAESGWGLSITHHASGVAFLAWYTYDGAGNPKWYVVSSCPMSGNGCTGTLYETVGPPFAATFDASRVRARPVGSATLRFSSQTAGTFTYSLNGMSGTKSITRQAF